MLPKLRISCHCPFAALAHGALDGPVADFWGDEMQTESLNYSHHSTFTL